MPEDGTKSDAMPDGATNLETIPDAGTKSDAMLDGGIKGGCDSGRDLLIPPFDQWTYNPTRTVKYEGFAPPEFLGVA